MAVLTVWVVGSLDATRELARILDSCSDRCRSGWARFVVLVTILNDTNLVRLGVSGSS
jgi:hypothetical protein